MGHRLAAVYAHPDDDTFGVGGTLLLNPDTEYTLIVATSGDAGEIADPALATREDLGAVREQEELDSLAALGVKDPLVHFLRYPDMKLADVPRGDLVSKVVELLVQARPDVVVTFGPEGITRHADHMTISEVATEAFHRAREGAGGGFQGLFYNAVSQAELELFWRLGREAGMELGNPDDPFMPRGVPDDTIAVRTDCSSVVDRKIEGIRAHRTQANEIQAFPDDLLRAFLGREYFVQAWPSAKPRERAMRSIFEGLQPGS
ncbi:MAG TPA: PIG-L deacetylase family protein [Actinomycetota bacterium]|nr:PIG-L deacetylase family protein [Actinomycetota bacterium]